MNIITTIPKKKYKNWAECEKVVSRCKGIGIPMSLGVWLINTKSIPKKVKPGKSLCYIVYDGCVHGYFEVLSIDRSEEWRDRHDIGKERNTFCIVLFNWTPIKASPYPGFQGYRYTVLTPLLG